MSDNFLDLNLRARRGDFALDLEAALPLAGITAVFGPSGSGKTSLLRLIAGFDHPDSGRVAMGDEVWSDTSNRIHRAAHMRPVGFVFQQARLFAHLTVAGNLDYARQRAPAGPARFDPEMILSALDLTALLDRPAARLSGGEAQRVALARALLTQPRLLLLDEPMAGLDRARKAELLPYLDRTLRQLEIPALYVSHSIDEVVRLADRVLAISEGRMLALGAVEDVLDRLDIDPAETGFETGAILAGHLLGTDERLQLSQVEIAGQSLELAMPTGLAPGTAIRLRIRARDVAIALTRPAGISIRNVLAVRITGIEQDTHSPWAELVLDLGGAQLRARLTRASVEELALETGQNVFALVKSASFDRTPG